MAPDEQRHTVQGKLSLSPDKQLIEVNQTYLEYLKLAYLEYLKAQMIDYPSEQELLKLKVEIGPSSIYQNPKPKRGYAVWIENGIWYTAPKISPRKFGGHAYNNGGYENGINECPCGCFMASSSSSGPVDPFGACPHNPKQTCKS